MCYSFRNPRWLRGLIFPLIVSASQLQAQVSIQVASLPGSNWQLAPQAEIKEGGENISTPGYVADSWVPAQVPGTVFNSYVLAGEEKDPNYGDNIRQVDKSKYERNFWYRTDFTVPDSFHPGRVWLNLDAVNRDADVFVNGKNVGSMHGFFQRGRFEITDVMVAGKNSLAVLDYCPQVGGNGNASSPAFICSRGWDWMPWVPGLNMGIYKNVYLTHTGDVSLIDPWIRTEQASPQEADLSIQTDLKNDSTLAEQGQLVGVINPGNITFSRDVTLQPGETQTVNLTTTNTSALHIASPRLWWPNGYGDPNLYTIRLAFRTTAGDSDEKNIIFGIRKYTYDTDNDTLHFHVNGVSVFPKGGDWGMAEYMLRCNAADYDLKLRLHREMHFNMIRNWVGMTPDEAFYNACDKYGVMVWDDFWDSGNDGLPTDMEVFHANAIEKIKQFRNHASIALWCGRNEATPPEPINGWLRDAVKTYDGDDRYYQENSHSVDISGSGPWNDLDLKQYFKGVPAYWGQAHNEPYGMRSEVGIATFTNFDSFKKFMPPGSWWPRNKMWNDHYFGKTGDWRSGGSAGPDGYAAHISQRYGTPAGIEEFCNKAQLLNYEAMKAMFEGWLDHSDQDASGILIWMSQSAYPSLIWQTYDYYYDLTGSYWAAKNACEPVHIYWNENDDRIRVVNTSGREVGGLTAEAWIFNMDGTQKFDKKTAPFTSQPDKVANCFTLTYPDGLSDTHFIRLKLTDASGKLVSENFYWRGNKYLDFRALANLKPVKLDIQTTTPTVEGDQAQITAQITNPADSQTMAFFIRSMLVKPSTGDQILPTIISDGYFSLIPGETKKVVFQYDPSLAGGEIPQVRFDCYNNYPKILSPVVKTDNLARGKIVTVSSTDDADGGDAAVDGDHNTRWSSAYSDPQWIMIDLGKSEAISHVRLFWETAFAQAFSLQTSEDGQNWTSIYSTDNGKGGVDDLKDLNGQGRYIRMLGTARGTKYGYSLYEFEVYGPNGKADN
jgi:beta-galactosidase/beta-glucuronidase